jgi:hypothetical protein
MKMTTRGLIVILAFMFGTVSTAFAKSEVIQIEPKGDKKIKIGVMDFPALRPQRISTKDT